MPRFALAQLGTGVLTGRAVDASTRRPVADVVVTATSPAAQGEQVVVTDATGVFRLPNLPPGVYALRFEVEHYHPYSRADIQLQSTVTLRVDVELLPETLAAEEVTVVAAQPTVDVGSSRSGVTVTSEFTQRVPIAPATGKGGAGRSFEQLAEVVPTSHTDTYGASIAGTTSVENQYIIDGLSVGDPGFGYNGTPLSIDFIKETNIVTGGYLPEYGRGGGGVIEAITKSGSNEFRASVFANYTPWQARPRLPVEQDAIRTYSRVKGIWDIGADVGGPLVLDKLWFYAGVDFSRSVWTLTRDLMGLFVGQDGEYLRNSDGLVRSGRIPGTRSEYAAVQNQFQYLAKLTFSPSANDRVELTHRGTPSRSGGDGDYSLDYETGFPMVWANPDADIIGSYDTTAWRQIFDAYDTSAQWTHSSDDKRLSFDTTIGWHYQRTADLPSDGSTLGSADGLAGLPEISYVRTNPEPHPITDFETLPDPSICVNPVEGGAAICPVNQYAAGGPQIIQDRSFHRLQLREVATLLAEGLGHHIIKAGLELELLSYSSEKAYPGGVAYSENAGGTAINDFRRYGSLVGPDESYTLPKLKYSTRSFSFGGFVQDSWAVQDVVTLNLGARYDAQYLYSDQGLSVSLPRQWSPRVGVIYDPTRKGDAKLFANYAIYYQTLPLNVVDRAGSGEPQIRARRSPANCDARSADYPAGCDDPDNLVTIPGKGPYDSSQRWAYVSVGALVVDPDLAAQSSSEFSLGGEYRIFPNARLGVTYIRRWMNNVLEDMSRDEGGTFFLGNPGRGVASDFPEAERNYDAGILSFTKTFSDLWLGQASYTLSWLRGNWEGLYRSQTDQLDPGTNSDFDLRSLTVNRYGDLGADRRHELKLFLARDIELVPRHHLNVGGSYRARSGAPTNYLARHPVYGNDEVFLLPRGSGERLPWQHTVDAHLGYTLAQTPKQTFAFTLDVFNLFNFRAVVRRSERYTVRDAEPITGAAAKDPFVNGNKKQIDPALVQPSDGDPRPFDQTDVNLPYGSPRLYQEPISLRFGLKATF
jgi:outer membrane receptor protein involved in Fe transport